ncbi:MAG: hypothetical protein KAU10_03760, partial [Dehalococcoidia bacterium]|nr:hypothetical protein [Dehalococcoidia bacterium]
AQSQELVEVFASLFRGRIDAWGQFPRYCKHEAVTFAHYARHLKGQVSLGIYPLLDDGTCPWIAADFDQPGTAPWHSGPDDVMPALRLIEALGYYGANQGLFLEKTKSKGWRDWLFFSAPVPAKHVRRLFRAAIGRAGLPPSVEIFPKQDFIGKPTPSNPFPVGNYVHLPYFGGGPSGPRSGRVFVDPKTLVPISLEELLGQLRVFPADALPLVLGNLPQAETKQPLGHAPEEVVGMLSRPLTVGERRPTLIKLAGYFRHHGIPEEVTVVLLLPWAERTFNEPLPPEELEVHIRGIYQRYGVRERKLLKAHKSWHVEVPL